MSEAESSDMCGPDGVFCSDDWKALNRLLFGGGSAGEAGEEGEWGDAAGGCGRSCGGGALEDGGEGGEGAVEVEAPNSAVLEVVARGSEGRGWPCGRGGMPRAQRALATLGEGAGGGGAS